MLSNINVSLYNGAKDRKGTTVTLADVVDMIQSSPGLKEQIVRLRKSKTDASKKSIKEGLPAVTFSGVFTPTRAIANIYSYTSLMVIDIDKIEDQAKLSETYQKLVASSYTMLLFISPSGNGLKAVVRIGTEKPDLHSKVFKYLETFYKEYYQLEIDPSGKDISRLCFLSHDTDLYINENAEVFGSEDLFKKPVMNAPEQAEFKASGDDLPDIEQFTRNIVQYQQGSRNLFVFTFACNCNRKGIDREICFTYSVDRFSDLDMVEIQHAVYGAYNRNQAEFGKYAKKQKKNDKGRWKVIPLTTSADTTENDGTGPDQRGSGRTEQKNDTDLFWYEEVDDKTGRTKYSLDYIKYFDFLEAHGFHRLSLENNTFELVHFADNICTPQMPHNIQDYLNTWCKKNNELGVLSMLRKGAKTYFAETQFFNLNYKQIEFARDTPSSAFFYFKNGIAEVTAEGINFSAYKEQKKSIWRSQIIEHEFVPLSSDLPTQKDGEIDLEALECEFARFISRAASNPNNKSIEDSVRVKRFFSHCSAIGYMLHDFKTKIGKAIIAVDHKMAADRNEQNGGTGKSIVGNSFKYLKKAALIDGREFKEDYPFRFDMLQSDTKIVVMQDCRYNLDFGSFFVPITGDFTYNRRNVGFRTIKYEDSPKWWFDTNFTFKGDGASFRRRQHIIEFDDYYNEDFNPFDDFGHYLFTDWDSAEMNRFYYFMLTCVQIYLECGLLNYPNANYDERKLVNECPQDFLDFLDSKDEVGAYLVPRDQEIPKIKLLQDWSSKCKDLQMTIPSAHIFSKQVKKYCKTRKLIFLSNKRNGVEYYVLRTNEESPVKPAVNSLYANVK